MRKIYITGITSLIAASALASASGQGLRGTMHGGQQPISGGRVYMFAPAQGASGAASISLIVSGQGTGTDNIGTYVTTATDGTWNIDQFTCPAPNVPIYLYSRGGDTGYGDNEAIAETAYVSLCQAAQSPSAPFVFIDEVTTVAMAYAVAGYSTDPLHVSYSGTSASLTGIANAFANANNLADSVHGIALHTIPSGSASAPEQTVNTLADALAACVNHASGDSNCQTLFNATTFNSTLPSDTATAVMNIAHAPSSSTSPGTQNGTNITSIMTLSNAYPQFTPNLQTAPNDLTLGLTFSSNYFGSPTAVAIDGPGNAWIASQPSTSNPVISVAEILNSTAMQVNNQTYGTTYTPATQEPESIAVDAGSQNIWIGTDNAVEEFSVSGEAAPGSPFLTNDSTFGGGYALNLDGTGNVWIGAGTNVYELSSTGSALSPTGGYLVPSGAMGAAQPSAIALDASNNVWVMDYANSSLLKLSSQGAILENQTQSNQNQLSSPLGVAITAQQKQSIANSGNNYETDYLGQSQFNYFQADTPPQGYAPGLTFAAVDGAGNSWLSLEAAACDSSNTLCQGAAEVSGSGQQLSGPGYTIQGFQQTNSPTANGTAIDGSGNVWILNKSAGMVTELVGAATPVVTPLALAVTNNAIGTRP